MAVKSTAPSATATPPSAGPAAEGSGADFNNNAELGSVEDTLMADLFGEDETTSGTNADAPTGSSDDGDDAADTDASEETTEEHDDGASGEEDESDDDTTDDSTDETEDDPAEDPDAEAGEETAKGTSPGAPKAITDALKKANLPKGILKRIDKAFAHSAAYRAKAEELTAQLASAPEPVTLAPTATHPLSDVTTAEELEKRSTAAEQWLEWCEDNRDGGVVDGKELTADDVRDRRKWAMAVTKHAPAREQWIRERQQFRDLARKAFPEMFKAGTPEFQAAQALVKGTPEIVRQPDYEISIADMVRGLKYRAMEAQGYQVVLIPPDKSKGKAAKPAAASLPGSAADRPAKAPAPKPRATSTSRPAPVPSGNAKPPIANLVAKARQTRSEADMEALLEAELYGSAA